jgi:hypothetical protein
MKRTLTPLVLGLFVGIMVLSAGDASAKKDKWHLNLGYNGYSDSGFVSVGYHGKHGSISYTGDYGHNRYYRHGGYGHYGTRYSYAPRYNHRSYYYQPRYRSVSYHRPAQYCEPVYYSRPAYRSVTYYPAPSYSYSYSRPVYGGYNYACY